MRRRCFTGPAPLLLALASLLAVGCATGEIDEGPPTDLAEFEREIPVQGELFVEVADLDGNPIRTDSVTISVDGGEGEPASCLEKADGACITWTANFAALQRVTAWTSVCGYRFGAPVGFGPEVDESLPMDTAVTIVAVRGLCAGSKPATP